MNQKLLEVLMGNAKVINEIYESVMTLRKAVAIVQTLLEEQLEDPEEQLMKVGLRHAEWDGESPHPYGCDGGEGPDAYVEPIRIAGKLEIQIGMLDGSHNREFCLHTMTDEIPKGQVIPFWTTRLKTEELMELRNAISEALLTASRFE
jgi:hypothetical protein